MLSSYTVAILKRGETVENCVIYKPVSAQYWYLLIKQQGKQKDKYKLNAVVSQFGLPLPESTPCLSRKYCY